MPMENGHLSDVPEAPERPDMKRSHLGLDIISAVDDYRRPQRSFQG